MRPLTLERPKPLIEVAGRPLLTHIIDALPHEVDSLVLVVEYLKEQIEDYFGTEYQGMPVTYVEQSAQKGTGGALRTAQSVLHDRFMVMLADDLHGKPALAELAQAPLAILGAVSREPEQYGVLTISSQNTLIDIEEKPIHPKSNLINTGAMVLDQRVFAYEAPEIDGEIRLTDMVTGLAKDAPITVVAQPLWCPVGRLEDIPTGVAFLQQYT